MVQAGADKCLRGKVGHVGCKSCSPTFPLDKNAEKSCSLNEKLDLRLICFGQLKPEKTCKPSRQKSNSPEIGELEKCADKAVAPDEAKGVVWEEGRWLKNSQHHLFHSLLVWYLVICDESKSEKIRELQKKLLDMNFLFIIVLTEVISRGTYYHIIPNLGFLTQLWDLLHILWLTSMLTMLFIVSNSLLLETKWMLASTPCPWRVLPEGRQKSRSWGSQRHRTSLSLLWEASTTRLVIWY